MVGAFLAAAVVTLVQFYRVREKRLLLLAAMFALLGNALGREWFDPWREWSLGGACLAGLALLFALSPRQPRQALGPSRPEHGSAASAGSETSGTS